jgi:HEAT repeat protein
MSRLPSRLAHAIAIVWLATAAAALAAPPKARRNAPAPAPAAPVKAASARAALETRLRAADSPPSEAELRSLGPGVDEALVAIAGDARVEILVRARAVSALAFFPTPPARGFLERALGDKAISADPGERLLLRKAAVAFGWQGGGPAARKVGLLLEHVDPDVRIDAAFALGLTRIEAAAVLLRKRAPAETDPRVRRQIDRQIRVIEEALRAAAAEAPAGGAGARPGRPGGDPRDGRDGAPGRSSLPPPSGAMRTRGSP